MLKETANFLAAIIRAANSPKALRSITITVDTRDAITRLRRQYSKDCADLNRAPAAAEKLHTLKIYGIPVNLVTVDE